MFDHQHSKNSSAHVNKKKKDPRPYILYSTFLLQKCVSKFPLLFVLHHILSLHH